MKLFYLVFFFFSSRRRHTRCSRDWSSDVCSSDLALFLRLQVTFLLNFLNGALDFFKALFCIYASNIRAIHFSLAASGLIALVFGLLLRSEERRVGKECRFRWWVAYVNYE